MSARSSWQRIYGEGEPTDFSAGSSVVGDWQGEPEPRLWIVPSSPEPSTTAEEPPQPVALTYGEPQWSANGYGRSVHGPGTHHWEALPPPPIDPDRGAYLSAKYIRKHGGVGLAALRDALRQVGSRR